MTAEAFLPVPPSTNNLYVNRPKGRAKSAAYTDWIGCAGLMLNTARLKAPGGPVTVCIRVGKMNAKRDVSNVIKPLEDLLVRCGVLPDDNVNHVSGVMAFSSASVPAGYVALSVRAFDAAPMEGGR